MQEKLPMVQKLDENNDYCGKYVKFTNPYPSYLKVESVSYFKDKDSISLILKGYGFTVTPDNYGGKHLNIHTNYSLNIVKSYELDYINYFKYLSIIDEKEFKDSFNNLIKNYTETW